MVRKNLLKIRQVLISVRNPLETLPIKEERNYDQNTDSKSKKSKNNNNDNKKFNVNNNNDKSYD